MKIIFSTHSEQQLLERNISKKLVLDIFKGQYQIISAGKNRRIAQKIINKEKRKFLVRVVFEKYSDYILIITAYFTTKIDKYWRT